jgi:hypothetical protein
VSLAHSIPQDPASPAADEAPDPAVLRAERRLRLLAELADIGMDLARALKPSAQADEAPDEAADGGPATEPGRTRRRDPAEAFAPLSRAIRLTLALEAKTDAELCDLKAGVLRAREEERTVTAERRKVAATKAAADREEKIRDLVVEAAEFEIEDCRDMLDLLNALDERLDEDAAYFDREQKPLRDIVEGLCADLTLAPDWSCWNGEGWTWTNRPARSPNSPFKTPSAKPLSAAARATFGSAMPAGLLPRDPALE